MRFRLGPQALLALAFVVVGLVAGLAVVVFESAGQDEQPVMVVH